jgi:hypothetical protein
MFVNLDIRRSKMLDESNTASLGVKIVKRPALWRIGKGGVTPRQNSAQFASKLNPF